MRVLLVKPPFRAIYGAFKSIAPEYPPLGLAYIAAVLEKNGHTAKIADMPAESMTEEKLASILNEYAPSLIGITATTPTMAYASSIAAICKRTLPNVPIILGGPHPTVVPDDVLKDENVDMVVRGEGEYAMLDIVKGVESGKGQAWIDGVSYKQNGKVFHNRDRAPIEDLDALPLPARHLVPMNKYYSVEARRKPMTTIFTSRGCPGLCIYCSAHKTFGRRFRTRSPKNIVDEIEQMVRTYGIREIHVLDDTFTLHRQRAMDICDEIIRRKLDIIWCCPNGVRVSTVDKELLQKMKQAGCYQLAFGVESGSQRILNECKKGITLDQSREAFRLCKEAGIETLGFFMMGLPGDNEETINETIRFAKELNPDTAKFSITIPYPGTELYERWKKENLIKNEDWSKYGLYTFNIAELPGLPMEKLVALHKKAYRTIYLNGTFIRKRLKKLLSVKEIPRTLITGASIIRYSLSSKSM